MKSVNKWKLGALLVVGGVVVQLGGCAAVLADIALNALLSGVTSQVFGGLTGTTTP